MLVLKLMSQLHVQYAVVAQSLKNNGQCTNNMYLYLKFLIFNIRNTFFPCEVNQANYAKYTEQSPL